MKEANCSHGLALRDHCPDCVGALVRKARAAALEEAAYAAEVAALDSGECTARDGCFAAAKAIRALKAAGAGT